MIGCVYSFSSGLDGLTRAQQRDDEIKATTPEKPSNECRYMQEALALLEGRRRTWDEGIEDSRRATAERAREQS